MKTIKFLSGLLTLMLLTQSCNQESPVSEPLTGIEISEQDIEEGSPQFDNFFPLQQMTVAPVIDPINGGQEVGRARLFRHRRAIAINMHSSNLIPGHTYTLWWVIYNKPENCVNSPCSGPDNSNPAVMRELLYATGKVVKRGNRAFFRAMLKQGDTSGSVNSELNLPEYGGLLYPETAEVHMVIRSHGPIIPDLVDEQIGTLNGGCTTSLPAFTEVPDEEGECANIQYAIFEVD